MYIGTTNGTVMTENITYSTDPVPVAEENPAIVLTSINTLNANGQGITVLIQKSGEKMELKSNIYFNRFE